MGLSRSGMFAPASAIQGARRRGVLADTAVMDKHTDPRDGTIRLGAPQILNPDSALEEVEAAWQAWGAATRALTWQLALLAMSHAQEFDSSASVVCIREDTSHLPPHGHLDDILDAAGKSLLPPGGAHDVSLELDEVAWEMYHVTPQSFARDPDGVRRLRIRWSDAADSP